MMLTLMLYFQQHCEKGAYFTCQLRKSLSSLTSCLWLQSNRVTLESSPGLFLKPELTASMLHHGALSFAFPYALAWFRTHSELCQSIPQTNLLIQVFVFIFFFLFHLHFLPNSLLEIQIFVSQGKLDKRLSWRKGNDREDLKKNSSWC